MCGSAPYAIIAGEEQPYSAARNDTQGEKTMCVCIRDAYRRLLKEWMDALLSCALKDPLHPSIDGAILCPACSHIHGRCHEAVYPLLAMADVSGETKYLDAARSLFRWSAFMLCDDGSLYNDSQSAWNGPTVFSAVSLEKALRYHGGLLTPEEKAAWEERLLQMAAWLQGNITPEGHFNINYLAANAAALSLIGRYFGRAPLLAQAKRLADFCFQHISGHGLVYGEGSLKRHATPRGGCAVDVGYNVEETLPSLFEYAEAMGDEDALSIVRKTVRSHLDFILPDGAWDNSFGTRNFKWTYWGSRTADGCQAMLNALGKDEPVFAEAAYRNLLLYQRCTEGLLYGGPHYRRHGEMPCVHHAFCHAKALAQVLDEGAAEFERTALPADNPQRVQYYPEIETYRLAFGDWRMTVCAGDFPYMKGGHVSGGAITLLWHRAYGPLIAAANTDYSLREPLNQQLTRKKSLQGSLCPRLEKEENGTVYSQVYDFTASVAVEAFPDRTVVHVSGVLCDMAHEASPGKETYALTYTLTERGLSIHGTANAALILPIVCPADRPPAVSEKRVLLDGKICVASAAGVDYKGPVFNLSPGFEAANLVVAPDEKGTLDLLIEIQ